MKKIMLYTVSGLALLSSCSSDFENVIDSKKLDSQITINAKPFEIEASATRSVLNRTESSIKFAWKDGESIGIFPVSPTTNIQAKKTISVSGSSMTATFDGEGWELKRGNNYAAYSPFNGSMPSETPYTAVPINMTGQIQNGNGNLSHIGDNYDYMYATSNVPKEGSVNLSFEHICAIGILDLTMPEEGSWTSATLSAEENVFTTKGIMNVSNGTVSSIENTSSVSLGLNNVSTTADNKKLTLYISILPSTTGSLTLTLKNSENKEYTAKLTSKTLVAGKAYKWTANLVKTSEPTYDYYVGILPASISGFSSKPTSLKTAITADMLNSALTSNTINKVSLSSVTFPNVVDVIVDKYGYFIALIPNVSGFNTKNVFQNDGINMGIDGYIPFEFEDSDNDRFADNGNLTFTLSDGVEYKVFCQYAPVNETPFKVIIK